MRIDKAEIVFAGESHGASLLVARRGPHREY